MAQLKKEEVRALVQSLVRYPLNCNGHEGYPKAEVTGGGTRLNDVDCSTMQSRVRPGLFLCGCVTFCHFHAMNQVLFLAAHAKGYLPTLYVVEAVAWVY